MGEMSLFAQYCEFRLIMGCIDQNVQCALIESFFIAYYLPNENLTVHTYLLPHSIPSPYLKHLQLPFTPITFSPSIIPPISHSLHPASLIPNPTNPPNLPLPPARVIIKIALR